MTSYGKSRIKIKTSIPGKKGKEIIEMSHKYMATTTQTLPVVGSRGRGVYVEDIDGNIFLDFTSGISVTNLGYNNEHVIGTVEKQLHELWHFAGTDFYADVQAQAAKSLVDVTPGKFDKKVFFTNSGTESVEAAIKIAKSFSKRHQFIGFIGSFHGRTHGSLSFTASKALQHKDFFPLMPGVEHVPYPDPYRNPFGIDGYEDPSELVNRVIDFIDNYVFKTYVPPGDVAGIMAEPVLGEGGYIVPPRSFFVELHKLARSHDIPLILDEVQTGFGRTGRFFASEHFGVEPEMILLAKSIASGIPMGAVVLKSEMDFPEEGMHSNTFGGNLLASAACVATIDQLKRRGAVKNSEKVGAYAMKRMNEVKERYEVVGDVRGLGLMLAIDFVKDRRSKEFYEKFRDNVIERAFKKGLLLLSTGRSAIRIIPPLVITEDEMDEGLNVLEDSIKFVMSNSSKGR
ncbi:MAG: hypothetical protein AMDU3_IPLC00002G0273 [Thermoplasmatales archaeon I-plasma]|nr:MAG: hypothetical protein AMDU3_IPLC00002G0273 [Thermoplasmatales archaeon I-plasma]